MLCERRHFGAGSESSCTGTNCACPGITRAGRALKSRYSNATRRPDGARFLDTNC